MDVSVKNTIVGEDILQLINYDSKLPRVSIFATMAKGGDSKEMNRITLKNLLDEADEKVSSHITHNQQYKEIVNTAYSELIESDFWNKADLGVAVFIGEGFLHIFNTDRGFTNDVFVGDYFYTVPLYTSTLISYPVFIADIRMDGLRLIRLTRDNSEEIDIHSDVDNLQKYMLQRTDRDKTLQHHSQSGRSTIHHGQNAGEAHDIEDRKIYFKKASEIISNITKTSPVIMAGTTENQSYFQTYHDPVLKDVKLDGDYKSSTLFQLEDLVRKAFIEKEHAMKEELLQMVNEDESSERVLVDMQRIIQNSFTGRISTLIVDNSEKIFGIYNIEDDTLEITEENGGVELGTLAANNTLLRGGRILQFPKEKMPRKSPMVAILRY